MENYSWSNYDVRIDRKLIKHVIVRTHEGLEIHTKCFKLDFKLYYNVLLLVDLRKLEVWKRSCYRIVSDSILAA